MEIPGLGVLLVAPPGSGTAPEGEAEMTMAFGGVLASAMGGGEAPDDSPATGPFVAGGEDADPQEGQDADLSSSVCFAPAAVPAPWVLTAQRPEEDTAEPERLAAFPKALGDAAPGLFAAGGQPEAFAGNAGSTPVEAWPTPIATPDPRRALVPADSVAPVSEAPRSEAQGAGQVFWPAPSEGAATPPSPVPGGRPDAEAAPATAAASAPAVAAAQAQPSNGANGEAAPAAVVRFATAKPQSTPSPAEVEPTKPFGPTEPAGTAEPAKPEPGREPTRLGTPRAMEAELGRVEMPTRPASERIWGFWLRRGASRATDPVVERPKAPEVPETPEGFKAPAASYDSQAPEPAKPAERSDVSSAAEIFSADDPPEGQPAAAHRADAEGGEAASLRRETAQAFRVAGSDPAAPAAGRPEPLSAAPTEAAAPAARSTSPYQGFFPPPAQQVARSLRLSLSQGGDRVTVQLQPESLGKVEILLSKEGGDIAARFRVETPEARQALAAEVPVLRQALEAKGITLLHVSVDLDERADARPGPWEPRKKGRRSSPEPALEPIIQAPAEGRWKPWRFEARA